MPVDPITLQAIGPNNKSWQGLAEPGNIINLYNRPQTAVASGLDAKVPKGTRSTTYSATYTTKDDSRLAHLARRYGKDSAILLPTVVDGKFLTDDQAIERYLATGKHLGIFDNLKSSEPYAQALHNSQQAIGNFYGATSKQ